MTDRVLSHFDEEILLYQQQIAVLRAKIHETEEARLTYMRMMESRALRAGQQSPYGAFPNGGQVAVRDMEIAAGLRQLAIPDGALSIAAKYGEPRLSQYTGQPVKGPRPNESEEAYQRRLERDRARHYAARKQPGPGRGKGQRAIPYGESRRKVMEVLSGEVEGMTTVEIVNFLGAVTPEAKKSITNAITNAANRGDLEKLGERGHHGAWRLTPKGEAIARELVDKLRVDRYGPNGAKPNGIAPHA